MKTGKKKKSAWKIIMYFSISVFILAAAMILSEYLDDAKAQSEFETLADMIGESTEAPAVNTKEPSYDTSEQISSDETVVTYEDDEENAEDVNFGSEGEESDDELVESTESVLNKYLSLYTENPDFGGWIRIEGTVIDYPVMYTPDEPEKYLHLSFGGEYSSRGVPFIDESCTLSPRSDCIIIYGHHMKSGSMFAALVKYEDESFYLEHKTIYFSTIYEENNYEVIAAFETDVYEAKELGIYRMINAEDENDFNSFISTVKSMSEYDTGIGAVYGEHLLILSTCSYHTQDGRFIVVAKKID